jgi:nicotinate-nucleotide adenylyltransferase
MQSFSEYARNRIAVFGGAFNPFHNGHLEVVKCLAKSFREVWVMPCANHAFGKDLAPANDRYRMCVLGTMAVLMTSVSRFELERGGVSYTASTIRHLRRRYPMTHFSFVISEGNLKTFSKWRDYRNLMAENDFIIVSRKKKNPPFGRNVVCVTPKLSSSKVRKRVEKGLSIDKMVPLKVAEYIKEHKLYR